MTVQRRLAAILVADVVGYSRLVGKDEAGTLARLSALRREAIEPTIAEHAGRLFKAVGDGFLVEFASAVQAVTAARVIQDANASGGLPLRIGIHVGDVVVEGDDLMGDAVNIAARIEGVADPGGVAISRQVHDQVRDKLDVLFVDKGEVTLKNLARPVQVFALGGVAARAGAESPPALPLPDKPSIAVLPFQNMSGDPEQEYFVDGLVEDIITALSRFKSLFVIARNSSFTYKHKAVDIKQVGRELGVRYVLEGSVRKTSGRVRITGQLIDSGTGSHLWADRFDGPLEEIFDLQDQVTARVVAAVAPRVEQAEIDRARRHPARSLDAYDCYLRALAHANRYSKAGFDEALRLARRANELDPDFSAAYGVAALCYGMSQVQGLIDNQEEAEAEVRRLAERVSLTGQDDAFALSSAAFAVIRVCRDHKISAALADQALAVNPNLLIALNSRAEVNLHVGDHAAAIGLAERAIRLNPHDPMIFVAEVLMAFAHLFEGRYDEAIDWATRSLARNPNNASALRAAAAAYAWSGRLQEAAKVAAQHSEQVPTFRVAAVRRRSLYQRPQDVERLFDGLRLAGVPQ
ncbi:MAG: adenylate/guanylate cyclase domain-containing protein [Reyranellaceae bacterium]